MIAHLSGAPIAAGLALVLATGLVACVWVALRCPVLMARVGVVLDEMTRPKAQNRSEG